MKKLRQDKNGFMFVEVLVSLIIVIALCLVGYLVYQHSHKSTVVKTISTSNSTPLMIVKYSGGLCANGNVCSNQYNLYTSGVFQGHTKLATKEVSQLTQVINETDFLQYPSNSHPNCPSASDGSDESLVFPQKYPNKTFTICELQIPTNDSAITFINNLIDLHQSK
jgi:hypothetical protein